MIRAILVCLILFVPGCINSPSLENDDTFILATTTSLRDSGLLDHVLEEFLFETQTNLKIVAFGTGAALNLGKKGDADLLIVHAPEKENQFIEDGFGISRTTFTYNHFVLVGPRNLDSSLNIIDAFNSLESDCFVSRGDYSGTHEKEQAIWQTTNHTLNEDERGVFPEMENYFSVGNGMAVTLTMANEMGCFTLSDRATYLHLKPKLDLKMTEFTDEILMNPYSIIQLNTIKEKQSIAIELETYLTSDIVMSKIENFTINGEHSFFVA